MIADHGAPHPLCLDSTTVPPCILYSAWDANYLSPGYWHQLGLWIVPPTTRKLIGNRKYCVAFVLSTNGSNIDWTEYINGALAASVTTTVTGSPSDNVTKWAVGCRTERNATLLECCRGNVHEIIVYDTLHGASTVAIESSRLATKWSIPLT